MANVVRNLSVVGLSDIETTVVKATYDDDDKPKPKHVDALLRLSLRSPNMDLMSLFRARLAEKSWNVVLKTLVVVHRIMNEGSEGFLRIVSEKPLELNTQSFSDRKSSLAWAMTKLVHVYGDYLCEKATVFRNLQFCGERMPTKESSKFFMELSLQKLVIVMPHIQMQLDKLLCCTPFTEDDQPHPIAAQASSLFIRDAFRLYSLTTVQILLLIDKFLKMNKKEATTAMECTKVYVLHSEKFKKWTDTLIRLKMIDPSVLPKFDNVPAGFTDLLAAHIKHCDEEAPQSLSDLVGADDLKSAAKAGKDAKTAPRNAKTAAAPAAAKPKSAAAPAAKPKPKAAAPPPAEDDDAPAEVEGGDDGGEVEDPFADPSPAPVKAKPAPAAKAAAKPQAAKPAAKAAPKQQPPDLFDLSAFTGAVTTAQPVASSSSTAAASASTNTTGGTEIDLSDFLGSSSAAAAAPAPKPKAAAKPKPVAAAPAPAAVDDPFSGGASAAAVDDPFGDMSGYAANAMNSASASAKPAPAPAASNSDPFNLL